MIIKNHTIELKDTSASEIARFRQMMLSIWRQQIEDDKNSDKMLKYVESSNNYSNIKFVSVYEVIECIKRKIGVVYPNTSFSKLIDGPINSTPEKLGIINYNDSQGAQKQGGISLEWNTFNGINLIAKTFKPSIEIGKYHTDFSLTIFDNNLKEIAFKFIVQDFDLYIALFDLLGVVITSDAQIIINLYLKKIKEANNNPSKLDVIYESLPRTLFGKMDDQELYEHLEILLSDVSYLEVIAPTDLDTNEDKAILQILYAISDRQVLYLKLRYSDLLYRIYNKLHGEEVQDLLRFLTRLVAEFDTSKPSDIVYFDNSYYLFRDTHIKTDWSGGEILINNYRNETQTIITYDKTYVPMELDSNMGSSPIEKVNILKQYLNRSFNPLAKLNFGTKLGDLGEQIGDENTFVIALKLHNMATKQSNWDLFNKATDLLSLLSAVGALRIVLAKGAPMAARALAGVVLAKDAAHYAMLSNGTLEKWHENGYDWLANLWIAFSVTADLASFGLPNLSKIAREGNAAAELAETAKDAKETRKVIEEANRIVEAETCMDVSKMSKEEFEDFFDYLSKWEGKPIRGKRYLGAKKLSKKELNAYIRKINEMSNGKSKLIILPVGDKFLEGNKAAFHPFSGNLYVEKGLTEFEIFHEFKHFEEFKKIGLAKYLEGALDITGDHALNAIRTYKREKYVFDKIMESKAIFNDAQIEDAQNYMNKVIKNCEANNVDITKIK
ncbi:zincin-like metallopeptidase toxin domain-containing protein [Flavobacterium sp. CSZ]|uniref:zincin-like metallopeptidase toxin domain-containing protein n=1 Tax=Flavobacterium sp. CSZ TaxID=2783791 RepID=UPI00188BBEC2|nr:zincin-like metallopeptidase toxin domain-containing protein [Flavobacterium sp. CSZ]MBF4484358.1 hypothetical protein [Flavobacterium sp. CSZ]